MSFLLHGRYWATVIEIKGNRALVSFSTESESLPIKMWVSASDIPGYEPPLPPLRYTGGGAVNTCLDCGNHLRGNEIGGCECVIEN